MRISKRRSCLPHWLSARLSWREPPTLGSRCSTRYEATPARFIWLPQRTRLTGRPTSRRRTPEWRDGAAGSTISRREHRRKQHRLTGPRHAKFKAPGGTSNGHRARSTPPALKVGTTRRRLTRERRGIWRRPGPGSAPRRIDPVVPPVDPIVTPRRRRASGDEQKQSGLGL